jgi:hypothetical protein
LYSHSLAKSSPWLEGFESLREIASFEELEKLSRCFLEVDDFLDATERRCAIVSSFEENESRKPTDENST